MESVMQHVIEGDMDWVDTEQVRMEKLLRDGSSATVRNLAAVRIALLNVIAPL